MTAETVSMPVEAQKLTTEEVTQEQEQLPVEQLTPEVQKKKLSPGEKAWLITIIVSWLGGGSLGVLAKMNPEEAQVWVDKLRDLIGFVN